jgi:hypothetical protein
MKNNSNYETVREETRIVHEETRLAYADCHMDWETGSKLCNLSFRASHPVSRDEAIKIFGEFVTSYNEFGPELLKVLPEDAQVTIARQCSVCIYVKGKIKKSAKLKCDEFDYYPESDETRIWWD